jgi:uncharacterized protein (DUF2236 family)
MPTPVAASINELPTSAAVYALYGGSGARRYVAYVGIAANLRQRIRKHLIKRNSTVTAATSAVSINPDYVTELAWWASPRFAKKPAMEAAEKVAFKVLDPALRTIAPLSEEARRYHYRPKFRQDMTTLFREEPAGRIKIPALSDALDLITKLEERVARLESMS